MNRLAGCNFIKVLGLSVLVSLAGYAVQPTGFGSLVYAEESSAHEAQAQEDQGEVTERGVVPLRRDHRKDATGTPFPVPPPPTKPAAPDPVFGNFSIHKLETGPSTFSLGDTLKYFHIWYGCRPIIGPCVRVEDVQIELWHTSPGAQPVHLATHQSLTLNTRSSEKSRGVSLNFHKVGEGVFTVKVVKGTSVLTRSFPVVPTQFTVGNPSDDIRDHRNTR